MSELQLDESFVDLELSVEVWLASENLPLGRLLDLQEGSVLSLSHDPDGPVDLVINGAVVASGELVVVDGKFGFRVTRSARRELASLDSVPEVTAADAVPTPEAADTDAADPASPESDSNPGAAEPEQED